MSKERTVIKRILETVEKKTDSLLDFDVLLEVTEIHTWFERDEGYVDLRWKDRDDTIVSWDNLEQVREAVEDGYLNPKDWHGSAVEYAINMQLISRGNIPPELRDESVEYDNPHAEVLKFMTEDERKKAYRIFLKHGNYDSPSGFFKTFSEGVFDALIGEPLDLVTEKHKQQIRSKDEA